MIKLKKQMLMKGKSNMQESKKSKPSKQNPITILKTALAFAKTKIGRFSAFLQTKVRRSGINAAEITRLKEYSSLALVGIFGFLMGIASFPGRIHPLAISAICSFSEKKKTLAAAIGAAVSCITLGNSALSTFIIYFFLYSARRALDNSEFSEPMAVRIVESAAASMAIGIVRISLRAESPVYSYIAFLSQTGISASFTYFFTTLFSPLYARKAKLNTKSISSYALMAAFVYSLNGVQFFGFNTALAAAVIITLTYAAANGFMHAGILGFILGIACANPVLSVALGLCGIVSGFVFSKNTFASLASFISVFTVCCVYGKSFEFALSFLPSVLSGCILFFPVCGYFPEIFKLSGAEKTALPAKASLPYHRQLSEAFFSLSDIFSKLAEKQKYPAFSDISVAVDKTFSSVCAGCALSEMCYARKKTDTEELKETLFSVLGSRPAIFEDFGIQMKDKCIRLENMCDELNRSFKSLAVKCAADNRTALLAAQYAGMARLITDTEARFKESEKRDEIFEKKVSDALLKAEIVFSDVCVFSEREKKTRITGVNPDKFPFNANEFRNYIFASTGTKITEPVFDISEKSDIIMTFERAAVLSVEYSHASKAKGQNDISGDTVSFKHSPFGFFHAFICDGMGSGKEAALASRLSCLFLENMLRTGTQKSVILELLNNLLLSQSNESFSTVDLFEADLITGKSTFIKAGAAPTYILRGSKLYKIFSATPPVGIISAFTAESTRFDTLPGDVIILLSDGVIQNGDDSEYLAELIKMDPSKDPSLLASRILEHSLQINSRSDDMTVAVIKVGNI